MRRALAGLVALMAAVAVPSHAATLHPEIDRAGKALERAAAHLKSAKSGDDQLAALGRAVTAHEVALAAFRAGLRALAGAEAALGREIGAKSARLERLIAGLQTLAQAPRPAIMVHPGGPLAASRSAALMAAISPALQTRIAALKVRLAKLAALRAAQEDARIQTRAALAALQDLRRATDKALRRRRGGAARADIVAQARAARAGARNIDALAGALRAAGLARKPRVAFSQARGLISLPVAGSLTAGFGQKDPWGRPGKGITLKAPAYAQVSAPWDGTVRYAGPLIDYGNVVVLEPERGILIVLAGLGRVDRDVGETVLAGERLGDLGGPVPATREFLLEASTDRDEIGMELLYIEVRRNGEAVDPAPWFDLTRKDDGG